MKTKTYEENGNTVVEYWENNILKGREVFPIITDVPIILQPTNQEVMDNIEVLKQGMMDIFIAVYDKTQGVV
ncbi:hypothetical protein [Clostridium estertheticum]|uniref:hypothetical protein n=1 Tax=Clostridium estertheticum TaxID=238834 RepID=UPI001C7D5927|nr:hypothetical protein [Clostridium estertheticum]MBX4266526.1 hypothetical protein [Clostridium estertheticum]WLC88134.1 hypothetical protein KTC95_19265 [Clostridium estertheticum]